MPLTSTFSTVIAMVLAGYCATTVEWSDVAHVNIDRAILDLAHRATNSLSRAHDDDDDNRNADVHTRFERTPTNSKLVREAMRHVPNQMGLSQDVIDAPSEAYASLLPCLRPACVVITTIFVLMRWCYRVFDKHQGVVIGTPREHDKIALDDRSAKKEQVPSWSIGDAYSIGHTCGEDTQSTVQHLDTEKYPSVQTAVDALNAGTVTCQDGVCIVRSERQKLYFMVARSDKRNECAQIASGVFNIKNSEQPFPSNIGGA